MTDLNTMARIGHIRIGRRVAQGRSMYAIVFDLDTATLEQPVRDIRMLRIEENNDLGPALD